MPALVIQKAAHLLATSQRLVVLTGAGISTPSGIPDFRSAKTGVWQRFDPMQVASMTTFRTHPDQFYAWFKPLARACLAAKPNPAHLALAAWEAHSGKDVNILTQNIEGLHQRAGSGKVVELHGGMRHLVCLKCKKHMPVSAIGNIEAIMEDDAPLPKCPDCGTTLKPSVVLFEELLPVGAWQQAEQACQAADLIWIIGTSLEVSPVNQLPYLAIENHAKAMIVNLTPTPLDPYAEIKLDEDVAVAVPEIVDCALALS